MPVKPSRSDRIRWAIDHLVRRTHGPAPLTFTIVGLWFVATTQFWPMFALYMLLAFVFYWTMRPRPRKPGGPSLGVPFASFMATAEGNAEPIMVIRPPDATHRWSHAEKFVGLIDKDWS